MLNGLNEKFERIILVFDAYSKKAVKFSKFKNPVNKMNAKIKWGMDNPNDFNKLNKNLKYKNKYFIQEYKKNQN